MREADLMARFGGDEFVLLLAATAAPAAVAEVAAELLASDFVATIEAALTEAGGTGAVLARLQIDRSFVVDLLGDAGSAPITNAIPQMGHGLGLQVPEKGVETAAQRDHLLAQGCDAQQGLLECAALPALELEARLRAQLPR